MPSRLERARNDPNSMKAKILAAARKIFGEFGYSDTTTRMIAKDVGIDISTLYYHWGEKQDLYEAVLTDLNDEIRNKLGEIERLVRDRPLDYRLAVAIDVMCDYLFSRPEASRLILFSYFSKTRTPSVVDARMTEHIANIAIALGLALDKKHVTPEANARVLAVWNSVINFTAGNDFFKSLLKLDDTKYASVVKESLKFILIPAFTRDQGAEVS